MFQLFHISENDTEQNESKNIYGDDTIQTIKEKIVEEYNKRRKIKKSPDEVYLFGSMTIDINERKLFESNINTSSMKKSILKGKDVDILNANYDLSLPVKDYTFEEFEKLKFKSKLTRFVPISQSLSMGQRNYLYSIDPTEAIFDGELNNSDDLQVISQDNHLLLKFGNITKLFYCFPTDIKHDNPSLSKEKEEFLFKLYFPKLYKIGIKSYEDYENKKYSLNKSTLNVETELFKRYLQEEKLKKINKGISKLFFIIHPQINMKLPMELIFKLVSSDKLIPLIKYDPGKSLENRYRLYTGNVLSKNGKKIPVIVSDNSYKISKLNLIRKRLTNENRVSFFIQEGDIEIYCQFIEDGNIEVKINMEKSQKLQDIMDCLKRNLNRKILYTLNSYLKKSGYEFPMFLDLSNEFVEIVKMDYEYELEKDDYVFDLKEYENCLTHIFNIKKNTKYEKTTDVIELKYKKVSSYNKMDAITELISVKMQYNTPNETIINDLMVNFKINRRNAVNAILKFKQEAEIQLDTFANKSLHFVESGGFDVKIEMKQNGNLEQKLFINVYNINNEKYIKYIDKYISFLIKIIKDDVDSHYKKLCKKVIASIVEKPVEILTASVFIDETLSKKKQLEELEKLRGSDDEKSDEDDDEIEAVDAFAMKDDSDSSSDDGSSSDEEEWFGGGGGGEKDIIAAEPPDENLSLRNIIDKTELKRQEIGENSNLNMNFNAKGGSKKELTFDLQGKNGYFVNRIRTRYPEIAVKNKTPGFDSYVRSCPSNMKRTPVILSQEEYDNLDDDLKNDSTSSLHPIGYKNEKKENHWFVCPRFWCFKDPNKEGYDNKPLTLKQVEEGKCGGFGALIPQNSKKIPDGKYIYEFTDKKYHNGQAMGKDPKNPSSEWREKYNQLYPSFLNKENKNGLCMPCCFNMSNKKTGEYQRSQSRKKVENECCKNDKCPHKLEKPDKTSETGYTSPIRGKKSLKPYQLGYMPPSLENFFQFDSQKICQKTKRDPRLKSKNYCLLRYGVTNNTNSFLSAIAFAYFNQNSPFISNTRKLKIENIDRNIKLLIKTIIKHEHLFLSFLIANKGNLYKIFFDDEKYKYKKEEIKKNDKEIFAQMVKSYGEKRAEIEYSKIWFSLNNFIEYLNNSENVKYEYLWDLITAPSKNGGLLFDEGINLLIFNNPQDDPIDKIEVICPKGSQYNNYKYNSKRKLVMLYKANDIYEPLVLYKEGSSKKYIKATILKEDFNRMKKGNKIWNIIKYISADLNEKCEKYPNNDSYFTKYMSNIQLEGLIQHIGISNIKYQIINDFYETIGIMLQNEVFVPCDPSSINKKIDMRFINDDLGNILQSRDYPEKLKELNINLENGDILHIPEDGQIIEEDVLVGYRTNTNQIILVEPEIDVSINDYKVNKILKTGKMNVDKERIESIKRIKMAKNFYIFFRNIFKIKLNEINNMELKKEISEIIEGKGILNTYTDKMDRIIEKLKQVLNEEVISFDLDEKNSMALCEYLMEEDEEMEDVDCIGITGKDNIYHFPELNLINKMKNEEHYYEKLSDELLRYEKIKKYIFLKNKYMNFDIVEYKISNNEILLLESSLKNTMEKWKKDELSTTINYIKYNNIFDKITKNDKENYTNKYTIDILDIQDDEEPQTVENVLISKDLEDAEEEIKIENLKVEEEQKSRKLQDGMGDEFEYKYSKNMRSKPSKLIIDWFIKYMLIAPPPELSVLIPRLKDEKEEVMKKWKEKKSEPIKDEIKNLFDKYWWGIPWDKKDKDIGGSCISGGKGQANKTLTGEFDKKFQSNSGENPGPNRSDDGKMHYSYYKDKIGGNEFINKFDENFMIEKLKELNSLWKIDNPLEK